MYIFIHSYISNINMAILYKAPAQANGKILVAGAANGNWANNAAAVTANNGHSFAKALEHVIAVNANNKFISYNNLPPDVPKTKTKSNSKGIEKCNFDIKQRSNNSLKIYNNKRSCLITS
ncbi:hypothetical protein T4E_6337 [Trichinella pseudospiralis]|uniref:Uncharacterized protein n=1 Tax=Trichinella pseudospiralis TaxID=6337 RepID=A0A0V0XGR2_TRIPS|nr:hypothetical protein T4E_6337 [Trichinella pseudospiralis]